MSSYFAPSPTFRRVMVFIDGGYLRKAIMEMFSHDRIDFTSLARQLLPAGAIRGGSIQGDLVRAYYYDAIVDAVEEREKFIEQENYFEQIRRHNFYEVKLGRLIKTKDGYRQKGVDVLLAIDMISKAYLDHYDIASLLGGDDLVDVVKAVKDTGRRVFGAFFAGCSKRLIESFDFRKEITKSLADSIIAK